MIAGLSAQAILPVLLPALFAAGAAMFLTGAAMWAWSQRHRAGDVVFGLVVDGFFAAAAVYDRLRHTGKEGADA